MGLSIADISGLATALGVLFLACQLYLQRAQGRSSFEDSLVREYRQLIKPHLVDAQLAKVLHDRPDEQQRLVNAYRYFDLCNEQVFLRSLGRVGRWTWRTQWGPGIRGRLTTEPVLTDWMEVKKLTNDFAELRAFERSGFSDPWLWQPWWRRHLHLPAEPRHPG